MWGRWSFRTPTKRLKTAWNEFRQIGDEDEFDIFRLKAAGSVCECILTSSATKQHVEEISDDVTDVFHVLLKLLFGLLSSVRAQNFPVYSNNNSDEVMFLFEELSDKIASSILKICEISDSMRDKICVAAAPSSFEMLLKSIQVSSSPTLAFDLLCILSILLQTSSNVRMALDVKGFAVLFEIPNVEEYAQCSSKVMEIILSVLRKACARDDSLFRSNGNDWSGGVGQRFQSGEKEKSKDDNVSLAAKGITKGLSIAANVIGEILKLTPITGNWTKGEEAFAKEKDMSDEDDGSSQIELIAVPVDTLEDEGLRVDGVISGWSMNFETDIESGQLGRTFSAPGSRTMKSDRDGTMEFNALASGLVEQGVFTFLLERISSVDSHQRCLDVLHICQLLVLKSSVRQKIFHAQDGYRYLGDLLNKIFDPHLKQEDVDLRSFTLSITRFLIEIMCDDLSVQLDGKSARSLAINNLSALSLLQQASSSKEFLLVAVMVRVAFVFMKANPLHVVSFEKCGVISGTCMLLVRLVEDASSFDPAHRFMLLKAVILLIQYFGVALSCRDISLLSLLMQLCVSRCPHLCDTSRMRSGRCHNCEDDAVVECVNEGCLKEGKHVFCRECDRVFHKPAAKRSHVRVICLKAETDHNFRLNQFQSAFTVDALSGRSYGASLSLTFCFDDTVLCILVGAIRGLIDDRRSRLQSVPTLFLGIFLSVLKYVVCLPPSEGLPSVHQDLSQIADLRDDICSSQLEKNFLSDNAQPPEELQASPRRCLLSLLLQCVSRLLLVSSGTSIVRMTATFQNDVIGCCRSERQDLIETFRHFSGDALFAFLLTSPCTASTFVQLTSYDRHFIIWCLREVTVTAFEAESSHATDLLRWMTWVLGAHVGRTPDAHIQVPVAPKVPSVGFSEIPASSPTIPSNFRIYVLQEIRLLLAGSDSEIDGYAALNFEIPLLSQHYLSGGKRSRTVSFESRERHRSSTTDSGSSTPLQLNKHQEIQLDSVPIALCRIPHSSVVIKRNLQLVGLTDVLMRILLGDLCPDGMKKHVNGYVQGCNSITANNDIIDPPSEYEIEEWICCFVTLIQFLSNSDDSKAYIDSENHFSRLVDFIMGMLSTVASIASNDWQLGGSIGLKSSVQSLFSQILLELCVANGRVIGPCKPFASAACGPQSTFQQTENGCSMMQLFLRTLFSNIRISTDLPSDHEDSSKFAKPQLYQLSPVYYMKFRLASTLMYSIKPSSLSFAVDFGAVVLPAFADVPVVPVAVPATMLNMPKVISSNDLHTFDGLNGSVHGSSAISAATRKRSASLRSKLSSSSLQNLDIEGANNNSWENESNVGFHSHHSMSQLNIVLGAGTMLRSLGGTPNASLHGDTTPRKLQNKFINTNSVVVEFDGSDNIVDPGAYYVPMFESLDAFKFPFSEKLLLLLNGALLFKSGDWSPEDQGDVDEDDVVDGSEHASYVPPRQVFDISPFVDPVASTRSNPDKAKLPSMSSAMSLARFLAAFLPSSKYPLPWEPQFSKILFRSRKCALIIVAACIICKGDVQVSLMGVLAALIECGNQTVFGQDDLRCLSKFTLSGSFSSSFHLFKLLGQLMKYNVEPLLLSEMTHEVCRFDRIQDSLNRILSNEQELHPIGLSREYDGFADAQHHRAVAGQFMCMLGAAAKHKSPVQCLCFRQDSVLKGGVQLNPCSYFPERKVGFSVCCWLRIGCLGYKAVSSLFQLHLSHDESEDSKDSVVMDAYFRTVVKRRKDADNEAATDSIFDRSQKHFQLCVSFGNSKSLAPCRRRSTNPSIAMGKSNSSRAESSEAASLETPALSAEPDWVSITNFLSKNMLFDDPHIAAELSSTSKSGVRQLSSSFTRMGIPDFIIDFDWTELGEWHLLCLSVADHDLTCTIDGKKRAVRSWSKNGYVSSSETEVPKNSGTEGKIGRSPLAPKVPIQRLEHTKSSHAQWNAQESRLDFGYPTNISRKRTVDVTLGGQQVEKALAANLRAFTPKNDECTVQQRIRSEKFMETVHLMLATYESMMGGFVGSISEFSVIEGVVEVHATQMQYGRGPENGLAELKGRKLTGVSAMSAKRRRDLGATGIDDESSSESRIPFAADENHPERKRSFPGSDKKAIEEAKQKESSFFTLFASTTPQAIKPDAEDRYEGFKFLGGVQNCSSATLENALKAVGGFRYFFPMLIIDKARQIGCMRIIHDVIVASEEMYAEYLASHTDKVIAFCCQKTTAITSLETLQVIFDSVCVGSQSEEGLIMRPALLQVLFDISVRCYSLPQLARCVIDWTKNICDDVLENCAKVLEVIGIAQILTVLSAWSDVEYSCSSDRSSELFKLQLSCGLLLRVLMVGSSGQQSQLEQIPSAISSTMQTGFSVAHLTSLFNFIHSCLKKASASGDPRLRKYNVWYFRRPEGARKGSVSNVLSSASSNSFTLRLDADPESVDWNLTAAIVALDSFLGAAEGPLSPITNGLLRLVFPNGALWLLLLDWMGHECIDVRARALKLLTLTLSLPNGQLDAKAVASFEKLNGFVHMADIFAHYVPEETTMELLLNLLFWRVTPYAVAKVSQAILSGNTANGRLNMETTASSSISPIPATPQGGGGILSLFWKSTVPPVAPANLSHIPHEDSVLFASVSDIGLGMPAAPQTAGAGVAASAVVPMHPHARLQHHNKPPIIAVGVGGGNNDLTRIAGAGATAAVTATKPEQQSQAERKDGVPSVVAHASTATYAAEFDKGRRSTVEFESIQIGAIFQVICKQLQRAQSPEFVASAFKQIEASVHNPSVEALGNRIVGSSAADIAKIEQVLLRARSLAERNAEALFLQRDWLIWICECGLAFRKKVMKQDFADNPIAAFAAEDQQHQQLLSDESDDDEKESNDTSAVGAAARLLNADSIADGSESGQSSLSWSVSGGGHGNLQRLNHEQLEAVVSAYCDPLFSLIERLLCIDMKAKPSTLRRWTEIFRLSTPDASSMQELILFDTLRVFESFPLGSRSCSLEIVLNYLRNFGLLLEQCLEKIDVSLDFCVRCVQSLHALIYKCPPDVRNKLKETGLIDLRNGFIVRCFLVCFHGEAGDLFVRALALSLIHSPLHNYMTVSEPKLLPSHVLLYVLSLFFEGIDELSTMYYGMDGHDGQDQAVLSRSVAILDALRLLVALIQSCVVYSQDCKKFLQKLTAKLPGDQDDYVLHIFSAQHVPSASSAVCEMVDGADHKQQESPRRRNFSDPEQPKAPTGGPNSVVAQTTSPTASSSWWSGWLASDAGASHAQNNDSIDETDAATAMQHGERTNRDDGLIEAYCGGPDGNTKAQVLEADALGTFMEWLCSPDRSKTQLELKNRLNKELQPVLRQMERTHDRNKKRQTTHESSLQDKLSRDKISHEKIAKDIKDKMRLASDKCLQTLSAELIAVADMISARIEKGSIEFYAHLQSPAVKALIEPLDNRFSMPPSVSKYLESSQAPSLETCDGQTEAAAALALRDLVDMFGVAR